MAAGQEFFRGIQGFGDSYVHIQIAVCAQATDKANTIFLVGKIDIIAEHRLLTGESDGVVWDVIGAAIAAVFSKAHRFLVAFPRREKLVFGYPGVGYRFVPVVHYGAALVFAVSAYLLEIQGSISQSAVLVAKVVIDWAAVENMFIFAQLLTQKPVIQRYRYVGMVEYFFHNGSVTVSRHSLVLVKKVIVVIVESYRQSLENACGQVTGRTAPLFLCIAFKKCFVKLLADKSKRLFLKIFWIVYAQIGLG